MEASVCIERQCEADDLRAVKWKKKSKMLSRPLYGSVYGVSVCERMRVHTSVCMYVCMCVCMHLCMHACIRACMHVCMCACVGMRKYLCVFMYLCVHIVY
jgi:hypothetical protein